MRPSEQLKYFMISFVTKYKCFCYYNTYRLKRENLTVNYTRFSKFYNQNTLSHSFVQAPLSTFIETYWVYLNKHCSNFSCKNLNLLKGWFCSLAWRMSINLSSNFSSLKILWEGEEVDLPFIVLFIWPWLVYF